MRLTRIVVVAALVASAGLAVPSVASATPVAAPYNVLTMSRPMQSPDTGPLALDATSTSSFTVDPGTPSSGYTTVQAVASTGVTAGTTYNFAFLPPSGAALAVGTTYSTTRTPTATEPGLDLSFDSSGCGSATGTLRFQSLTAAGTADPITEFAANYTYSCDGSPTVSGIVRYNSAQPFTAVAVSPAGWDFGWQITGSDGTPKTFTLANRGSEPFHINTATFPDQSFRVTGGTCVGVDVASGDTCTVTVTPHPLASISNTYPGTLRSLHLALTSGTVDIPVRVEGRPYSTTYVQPGPGRITFTWGLQPNPIGSSLAGYFVYRGTVGHPVAYYRTVGQIGQFTDTGVTPGQPYYYQVKPKFQDGSAGDLTPRAVAATAWPIYSSGMYHRLSTSVRILSSHTVVSGHPYTLQVTGKPGVPTTGVSTVALQITAAKPTSTTAVTVYPYGTSRPAAPDLTVTRGSARTNFVLARIGSGGRIVLSTSSGYTPISVDVFGFYSAPGLSTAYGQGGAMHTYLQQGTILDTKGFGLPALPSGYYIDAPVDFDPIDTPHVTSLLLEVTAYGSTSGGTVTAYPTNMSSLAAPGTSALTYAGGRVTTNVSLIAAGRFTDSSTGSQFPSVRFLNRGSTAVHLIVTILGFVDDNTFSYGERYTPGSAVHLLSTTMYSGSTKAVTPGTNAAGRYTTALNAKVLVGNPAATTAEALWPGNVSNVTAPARPQIRANAHETTLGSAPAPLGNGNVLDIRNTSGQARVDLWSFGRFDYYPQPTSPKSFLAVQGPRPDQLAPAGAPVPVRPAPAS